MHPSLQQLFDTVGVVSRKDRPADASALDWLVRSGEVEAVLPGVYALTGQQALPDIRVRALQRYEPRAVLIHEAAARYSFWPTLPIEDVAAAVPRRPAPRPGFHLVQRTIPTELVTEVNGVRLTVPALTAVDLGADAIDHALRTDAATLAEMRQALDAIPRHRRNRQRHRLLEESSGVPWSRAEREFHRLLREAGITGWQGNVPLTIGSSRYVVDIVFRRPGLVVEIDGRHFHGDATFESDRWRQNALVLAGWRVLRFTWSMIENHPDRVVGAVRQAISR